MAATREALNWPHAAFEIPDEIRLAWSCCERGDELHAEWQARWQMYQDAFPSHAQELRRRQAGQMPAGWAEWGQQIFDSMQSQTVDSDTSSQSTMFGTYGAYIAGIIGWIC